LKYGRLARGGFTSVSCEQRVEYKYFWWKQIFLSNLPTFCFPNHKYSEEISFILIHSYPWR
jgi:hypothetical protein